ncbi:unnamed protein product [Pleuronectes platessa]|uniref:Uncharacterized protein n=1 Tax=Pleuronectes platessa TaxID=8262 RepID=A0A9N7V0S0_PLEPL|nr:unnamed protein product [Pleuronectes platessa]
MVISTEPHQMFLPSSRSPLPLGDVTQRWLLLLLMPPRSFCSETPQSARCLIGKFQSVEQKPGDFSFSVFSTGDERRERGGQRRSNSSLPLIHPYQREKPSSHSTPLRARRILELTIEEVGPGRPATLQLEETLCIIIKTICIPALSPDGSLIRSWTGSTQSFFFYKQF